MLEAGSSTSSVASSGTGSVGGSSHHLTPPAVTGGKSPRPIKAFHSTLPVKSEEEERRRTSSFGGVTPREQAIINGRNARLARALTKQYSNSSTDSSAYNSSSSLSASNNSLNNSSSGSFQKPVLTTPRRNSLGKKKRTVLSRESKGSSEQDLDLQPLAENLPTVAEDMWNKQFQDLFESVNPYCRLKTINEQYNQQINEHLQSQQQQQQQQQQPQQQPVPQQSSASAEAMAALKADERVVSPGIGNQQPTVISEPTPMTMVESIGCSEEFKKTFEELFPNQDTVDPLPADILPSTTNEETPRGKRGNRRQSVHFALTR